MRGFSSSRFISSSRSFLFSYSKVPPQRRQALLEVLETAAQGGEFHGVCVVDGKTEMVADQAPSNGLTDSALISGLRLPPKSLVSSRYARCSRLPASTLGTPASA